MITLSQLIPRVKLRKRTRATPSRSETSIYGPDPGDAQVEYAYHALLDRIREDILYFREYPRNGERQRAEDLARALLPQSGKRRRRCLELALLTLRVADAPSRVATATSRDGQAERSGTGPCPASRRRVPTGTQSRRGKQK